MAGVPVLTSSASTPSERAWLAGYAIAAFIYRLLVMLAIALFIAREYFFIGSVLALWVLYLSFVHPLIKVVGLPMTDRQLKDRRKRIISVSVASVVFLFLIFGVTPFPYSTVAEGVLSPTEESMVRAGTEGFVESIQFDDGESVREGELLVSMNDPALHASTQVLKARVDEAQAVYQAGHRDRVESDVNREVLQYSLEEYGNALERQQTLSIYSKSDGLFKVDDAGLLQGRYFERGDALGYVVDFAALPVTVLIHEDDIDRVRSATVAIDIRKVSEL